MDGQVIHQKSNQGDCDYEESCVQANGNAIFHSRDGVTATTTASEEGNTKGSTLCPITPIPCRENGDSVLVASTPLSVESPQSSIVDGFNSTRNEEVVVDLGSDSSPRTPDEGTNKEVVESGLDGCPHTPDEGTNKEVVESGLDGSPHTPDEGVFDPFAPGPDKMLLAPICKKVVKQSQKIVARRLNFDDSDDFPTSNKNADTVSEKVLLESFYGTLLEAIILKQSEEFLAENHSLDLEDVGTPISSPPPLTGVAETCPGAPVKATAGKSRNIDRGLCRKLEF